MVCSFQLRTETLSGSAPDGVWSQIGYSVDGISYGAGGTQVPLFGDDPTIDPSGLVAGYYKFSYSDGCNAPQQVIVKVSQHLSAGIPTPLTYCKNDNVVVSLFDGLLGESAGGTWTLSPNSTSLPSGAYNLVNGTLNLALLTTHGVYRFIYSVMPPPTAGYTQLPCAGCSELAEVVVTVTPAFNSGSSNTIVVSDTAGAFSLFDNLIGVPDTSGAWTQVTGASASLSGGYLGTVNLNSLAGCSYSFKYYGGSGNCYSEATVTVVKTVTYGLGVTYASPTLTATYSGCASPTFQWYSLVGVTWTAISGATSATYNTTTEGQYKVILSCGTCTQEATYTVSPPTCNNTACFNAALSVSGTTYSYSVTPNGTQTSPITSDVFEYSSNGGSYVTFNPATPISGCVVAETFNVTPFCSVNGGNIRVGYDTFTSCVGRSVTALAIEYGDGSQTNRFGFLDVYDVEWTPAQWIAKGRTATFRIRVSTPLGSLIKLVTFTYTGTGSVTCTQMTITNLSNPVLFYPLVIRRTVTYSDGCPQTICSVPYNSTQSCDALDVYLTLCNVSNPPTYTGAAICVTVTNCSATPTRVWKKDGVVLAGETGSYVPTTYGNGVYQCDITCGACTGTDTYILQSAGCTAAVSVTLSGSTLTAAPSGCSGGVTYQWAFLLDGTSTWTNLGTASTQAVTTTGGTYRVTISCGGCTAQGAIYVANPCTGFGVSISQASGTMTANVTGCSGPTYQWQYQNTGGVWVNLGTASTQATSQGGATYRVNVICGTCTGTATYTYTPTCSVVAIITSNGLPSPTLTGSNTGCVGTVTYTWHRLNNGVSWDFVGSGATYSPTTTALYRLTVTCGGCSDTEVFNYSNCTASVTISATGASLAAITSNCTGTTTYQWSLSTDGGVNFSNIATTQSVTASQNGIYRVTVTCGGCTAQATYTYTSSCTSSVSLAYNSSSNVLTATNTGCSGTVIYVWQFSPNYNPTSQGCTGWTQVASGVSTYVPTQTGCYRVLTSCGSSGVCPSEDTEYVVIANPCTGLSMAMTATTGLLSFGQLLNGGIAVANYLISWVNSSNVEVFRSAAGSYYNAATTRPHPSSNVPLPSGTYTPIILNSSVGNNLNCFSPINVPLVQCADNYSLNYDGAGGVAASNSVSISVNATTGHLKIFLQTFSVADTLTVVYNGSTVFNSGAVTTTSGQVFVVPITYVSGQNAATVTATNSTPSQNTQYNIKIACCQVQTPCPITLTPVTVGSVQSDAQTCACYINLNWNYGGNMLGVFNSICRTASDYTRDYPSQYGGCSNLIVSTNYGCVDCPITIVKNAGASFTMTFGSACNARYLAIKASLQGITNPNQYLRASIRTIVCVGDAPYFPINIFPNGSTITYNDTNRSITVVMSATNPYADSCTNCTNILRGEYASAYSNVNNGSSYLYNTFASIFGYDIRTTSVSNVATTDFSEKIVTSCGTSERKYRISFRNAGCPCQSYQIHEDTDNNGSYETLRAEAAGWTGSCI